MSRFFVGLLVSCAAFACGGPTAEPQTPEEAAPEPAEVTAPRVESTPESSSLPVSGAAPEAPVAAPMAEKRVQKPI